jgi:hypothetical protein
LGVDSGSELLFSVSTDISDGTNPEEFYAPEFITETDIPEARPGDAIDAAIEAEPTSSKAVQKPEPPITHGFGNRRRKNPGEPKTRAPDADEWMDFFSRIVIRFGTEWYVDAMFRNIDEESVDAADAIKLLLTEEERDIIARPFAEYANKNPFLKKHGRQIVALSDSFESVVILSRWFSRVNRVARKYRPKKPAKAHVERLGETHNGNGRSREAGPTGPDYTNGLIPNGYSIFNPGGN